MQSKSQWWQKGVVYQVYPRSFQDSNNDGIGDLKGITQRLNYLHELGVDAIWISPFYPSPMADFGYDISDYTAVDPIFGTMADFDELLKKAHQLGLRIIIDFVANHTSEQHDWFLESRSSKDNPKRDWYIWADPAPDGGPPNNWLSIFGGLAWEYDEKTAQYYMHSFLKEQPDLNWRNDEVKEAVFAAMRFWLDKGVDGFRLDAINYAVKDDQLRDNPVEPSPSPWDTGEYAKFNHLYSKDRLEIYQLMHEMRSLSDEYPERMLIGEVVQPDMPLWVRYYGDQPGSGLHMPFNFGLLLTPWKAEAIAAMVEELEEALPDWAQPNYVLGNHDRQRVATRLGINQARNAMMLLLTLRGTPTIYYGDELGMQNVDIPLEKQQDPWGKNVADISIARDGERTPMQWNDSSYCGFSNVEPWLPLTDDCAVINVETQEKDQHSMLTLTRQLLNLRRRHPALHEGSYRTEQSSDDVYSYRRCQGEDTILVALNLSGQAKTISLDGHGEILLSTQLDRQNETAANTLQLRPYEGLLLQMES